MRIGKRGREERGRDDGRDGQEKNAQARSAQRRDDLKRALRHVLVKITLSIYVDLLKETMH